VASPDKFQRSTDFYLFALISRKALQSKARVTIVTW
jgi:hypothetical protein